MCNKSTLFIWDFDNTIVLDNTDTIIFRLLAPDLLPSYTSPPVHWTTFMSTSLSTLHSRNISPKDIMHAASAAPLPADTAYVLRAIFNDQHAQSVIVSDANSLFIEACLKKAALEGMIEGGVITNPAQVDEVKGIVLKEYVEGHGCGQCPRNMCKGEVVRMLLNGKYKGWRPVYVGDGGNDYCGVLGMHGGEVYARKGLALHKRIEQNGVHAAVRTWDTPQVLKSLVMNRLST